MNRELEVRLRQREVMPDVQARVAQDARGSVVRLVGEMAVSAKRRDLHQLNAFFLTEALFKLKPLFPFTD